MAAGGRNHLPPLQRNGCPATEIMCSRLLPEPCACAGCRREPSKPRCWPRTLHAAFRHSVGRRLRQSPPPPADTNRLGHPFLAYLVFLVTRTNRKTTPGNGLHRSGVKRFTALQASSSGL